MVKNGIFENFMSYYDPDMKPFQFVFKIITPIRVFFVQAESQEDMASWIDQLTKISIKLWEQEIIFAKVNKRTSKGQSYMKFLRSIRRNFI